MTKHDLEQVFYLRKELKMWQKKLADLQADIAISPKPLDGMPFQNTNLTSAPTEDKAIKMADISEVINGKIKEIQLTIAEVEKYILTIEDSYIRQILEYRCCKCLTWEQIADELGGSSEAIRQTYHRFLADMV